MKVGFASADFARGVYEADGSPAMGGSGWVRIGQYLPYLNIDHVLGRLVKKENSSTFGIQEPNKETWDGKIHWDCDVIVMQRYMDKEIPKDLKNARKAGQIIVQDVDDWYWGLSTQNQAYTKSHPTLSPDLNVNHYRQAVASSDWVIVSTPYLRDRLGSFVKKNRLFLHVNHVDVRRFSKRHHADVEKPTIGWVGSTAHRSGDLAILRGVLSTITNDFAFHHTGRHMNHESFADEVDLPAKLVSTTPLMTPQDLPTVGYSFDIGIAPMSSMPFNEAKSWIKGIEYAAAGIPFVASPRQEYRALYDQYGIGRLAKKGSDWIKHFYDLKDWQLRQEESEKQYNSVLALNTPIGADRLQDFLIAIS